MTKRARTRMVVELGLALGLELGRGLEPDQVEASGWTPASAARPPMQLPVKS